MSGATYFLGAGKMSAWFPAEASSQASGWDGAFFNVYLVMAFVVVFVLGLALTFIIQFRRKKDDEKAAPTGAVNKMFVIPWVIAAVALGLFAFTADFGGFLDRNVAPLGALDVGVTARQGDWDFVYPNGHVSDTLQVATGRPVKLTLQSEDVTHSLSIPAVRLNQPILPDRTTEAWFTASLVDTFSLRSSTYSGPDYHDMKSALVVQEAADFDAWLQASVDIFVGRTLVEVGELLYTRLGCKACHSLDGSKLVGPSFKDVYGNSFETREGTTILVDDAYVRESILTPNVSVIAGYEPVMTPYEGRVSDQEIEAITAWLKTLSSYASNPQEGN